MLRTQGLKLVGKPCIQTVQNDAKSSKALQHSRQAYEILNKQRHLSLWSENDQVDSVWISQKKIYQNNTVTVFHFWPIPIFQVNNSQHSEAFSSATPSTGPIATLLPT